MGQRFLDRAFISNLGNNSLLLGNADGKATAVTFSGDVTIDNVGVSAIGKSKVLSSMILDGTLIEQILQIMR
jgi:hypothetical protein